MKKRAKTIFDRNPGGVSKLPPQVANEIKDKSLFFRELLAEREEVMRHKWFLSEKAGRDVGIHETMADWVANHQLAWRKSWRARNLKNPSEN